MLRKCTVESEKHSILTFGHFDACVGDFKGRRTIVKVLQNGFFGPIYLEITHHFCLACDHCQHIGVLSHCDMMVFPLVLIIEIFDVWGIVFMGYFSSSFVCVHILVAIDHVPQLVEALATMTMITRLWPSL